MLFQSQLNQKYDIQPWIRFQEESKVQILWTQIIDYGGSDTLRILFAVTLLFRVSLLRFHLLWGTMSSYFLTKGSLCVSSWWHKPFEIAHNFSCEQNYKTVSIWIKQVNNGLKVSFDFLPKHGQHNSFIIMLSMKRILHENLQTDVSKQVSKIYLWSSKLFITRISRNHVSTINVFKRETRNF